MVDDDFAKIFQFFSTRMAPFDMTIEQNKQLVVKATNYQLITGNIYKLSIDGIL
jgi:hypothetical protein